MSTGVKFTPWVTLFIIAMNVIVFIVAIIAGADVLSPSPKWLFDHGGNYGPATLSGEQWRLVTSMFLHVGVMHLAMNMIGLLQGGTIVERMYGRAGFVVVYLLSGIAGSFLSALAGDAVSAGASGAIFGVFGAFGAYLLVHRDRLDKAVVTKEARNLAIFLGLNIVVGLNVPQIDMRAHIGGVVAGFLVGLALEARRGDAASRLRRNLVVGLAGLALAGGGAYLAPTPFREDTAALDRLAAVEARWNELVGEVQANTIDDAALADAIERDILPRWRAASAILEPKNKNSARPKLRDYLAAREDGWSMMLDALRAGDEAGVKAAMKRFAEADHMMEK